MAEKKKPAAKKKTAAKNKAPGKTHAAKTAGRKKPAPGKTPGRKKTQQRSFRPVYILTIMVLLTIIILMVNTLYFRGSNRSSGTLVKNEKSRRPVKAEKQEKKEEEKISEKNDGKNTGESIKKIKARIYFVRFNERSEKSYLTYIKRSIDSRKPVESALKELIRGLSPSEERRGLLTAVPENLKLRNVRMRDRTAELDFNGSLQWGATGNILLNRIDQIVYTATQFENVDSVIIKINGKTRRTLGGEGLSISGPLQRRVN